jgi:hypothetical protein
MADVYLNLADPEVFDSYFKSIAVAVKALSHSEDQWHFYNADLLPYEDAFASKLNSPALVCYCLSTGIINSSGSSMLLEYVSATLAIIAFEENVTDGKMAVLRLTKEIVYQILAKLEVDRRASLLPGFDLKNCKITQIDNVHPKWHGYQVQIPFKVPVTKKLYYDEGNYN